MFFGILVLAQVPSTTIYVAEASEPLKPVVYESVYESVVKKKVTGALEAPILPLIQSETPETIKELIEKEFGVGHVMVRVAMCESGLKHLTKEGTVLKSHYGTDDLGVFQINGVHKETLQKLGLDRTKIEDNIKFAKYLYEFI